MILPETSVSSESSVSASGGEVLVRVEGVSKKFCRGLKRSLWYGVQDVLAELNPFRKREHALNNAGNSQPSCNNRSGSLRKDEFWAVNNVSFELRRGECLGLIGHNGAGKTTLLKMLNGLVKPDTGRIEMRGRVGALIALGAGFNPVLTGRENIYVNGSVLGLSKREIDEKIDEIIDFAEVRDFIDSPVQSYSSGMTVRLGFAIAVKTNPDILLLDEVLAVGDIGFQAKCFNTLAEFKKQGVAFILVSHNMHLISRYSDRVLYLQHGKTKHCGTAEGGINLFTRDMDAPGAGTESTNTDWSRAYGSGKLCLESASFVDQNGNRIESIEIGAPVILELSYNHTDESLEDIVIDIKITSIGDTLFQTTSEECGIAFGKIPNRGKLAIHFPIMPINSPKISFSITIFDKKSKEVYDWKRNIDLYISNKPMLVGKIDLRSEWKITDLGANENHTEDNR